MNKQVTSREAILSHCRQMVMEKGIAAVDMRGVASACEVALGSLYNYFPSKSALIAATVESVWTDIFYGSEQPKRFDGFLQAVQWVYDSLRRGRLTYPGFFTLHALSFANRDKQSARRLMHEHFDRVKQRLLDALRQDAQVNAQFGRGFLPEGVVDLAFDGVVAAVLQEKGDISVLVGLLERALYPAGASAR